MRGLYTWKELNNGESLRGFVWTQIHPGSKATAHTLCTMYTAQEAKKKNLVKKLIYVVGFEPTTSQRCSNVANHFLNKIVKNLLVYAFTTPISRSVALKS